MKRIYTGIDIGSYAIKIVVSEYVNGKFHILASTSVRSKGIKNGLIVDIEKATGTIKKAKQQIEGMIGVELNQAIVSLPSDGINFDIVDGSIKINPKEIIDTKQITDVFSEAILGRIEENRELVTIMPISFQVDDKKSIKDPKGMIGEKLTVKALITTIPKYFLKQTVTLCKECDIEIVDFGFSSLGDYYEVRNKEMDNEVIGIVNIGYDVTEVSIFNKGIMIKDEKIDVGSKLIDFDISKRYQVKKSVARYLKENFAVSNTRYADVNDIIEVTNIVGEGITINQLEISETVERRLVEILKLAKKQINILTNREISYIIITGGISELAGFQYVVENIFDRRTSTFNIGTIGVRSNIYSSVLGLIKYFHYKLELRGESHSMFNDKQAEELISTKRKETNSTNDNIISKVFGYFS